MWYERSVFYHIYPLGYCGAESSQAEVSAPVNRLRTISDRLDYLKDLGITAMYLGPLFSSESHGYDTLDYFRVDKRLGSNADLTDLIQNCHDAGIRVVLDGVFNHTGRGFFAFQDLLARKEGSAYASWYKNLDFSGNNAHGDGFRYDCWAGHEELPQLDQGNNELSRYFQDVIEFWIAEFDIDGIRFDAAQDMDFSFLNRLSTHGKSLKDDFFTLGEVVHGDYNNWMTQGGMDSLTNYEAYKGLYSSHNDGNFFEIAWTLNRQFGPGGLYRQRPLYSFADNHDVHRLYSILENKAHAYTVYGLLFTIPGIPSIYYGSEWAFGGMKRDTTDDELRPEWMDSLIVEGSPDADLFHAIQRLIQVRKEHPALSTGDYQELFKDHHMLVFKREGEGQSLLVAVNSSDEVRSYSFGSHEFEGTDAYDVLNNEEIRLDKDVTLYPHWLRVLRLQKL